MSGQGQGNGEAAAQTDTTYTKIFVGGLASHTTEEDLTNYFQQFGEIIEVKVIYEMPSGRSKGYGFVTFKEPESATRACENSTLMIDGKQVNCRLAYLGAMRNNNKKQVHQKDLAPAFLPYPGVLPIAPSVFASYDTYYFGPYPRYGWYQYIPMWFPMIPYNININVVQPGMLYMFLHPFDGQNWFNQNEQSMQGLGAPQEQHRVRSAQNADDNAEELNIILEDDTGDESSSP